MFVSETQHNYFLIICIDRRIYLHGVFIENQSTYWAVTLLFRLKDKRTNISERDFYFTFFVI